MQISAEIYHTNLAQIYSRTRRYRINMNLISVAGRQEISLTLVLITMTVLVGKSQCGCPAASSRG